MNFRTIIVPAIHHKSKAQKIKNTDVVSKLSQNVERPTSCKSHPPKYGSQQDYSHTLLFQSTFNKTPNVIFGKSKPPLPESGSLRKSHDQQSWLPMITTQIWY